MTLLKPIFIKPELKKTIEFHKAIKGFKDIGSALIDLLNDSDKYLNSKNSFNEINKPKMVVVKSDTPEEIKEELSINLGENDEMGDTLKI